VRSIFGGFLLGQSVSAAQKTVSGSFNVHSLQSTFLKPANALEKLVYTVERIADGRTFTTRLVRAIQAGVCVYVATIGFQQNVPSGSVLDYGAALPHLRGVGPEDASLSGGVDVLLEMGMPSSFFADGAFPDPFEWRHFPRGERDTGDPTRFRLLSFVRASVPLSTVERATHLAALAFFTDEWLIFTVNLTNGQAFAGGMAAIAIQATVTHSIWFHDPHVRVDQWMVCERHTSWGAGGRILIHQSLWDWRTGRLIVSCTQEGTLRFKNANL
jgi:acyl-CoA thioesterase II